MIKRRSPTVKDLDDLEAAFVFTYAGFIMTSISITAGSAVLLSEASALAFSTWLDDAEFIASFNLVIV